MLIEGMEVSSVSGALDTEIKGLNADSRRLSPGDLYVALRGENFDGHDFIDSAVEKGAAGVVCRGSLTPFSFDVVKGLQSRTEKGAVPPFVYVEDTRKALAYVSNNFYGRPSEKLTVIGVTGTNGKTTAVHLIKSILETAGKNTGLTGTISYMIGDRRFPAPYTTPGAIEYQGLLSEMLRAGLSHVVSEVSSHALSQKRVDCTRFQTAVFTNLTRDHLDFHKNMEEYFEAKKRLFTELLNGVAVINMDDAYGKRLYSSLKGETLTYGIDNGIDSEAGLRAYDIKSTSRGLSFRVKVADSRSSGPVPMIESPLLGLPNVYNILSAIGVSMVLGISWDAISNGIKTVKQIEGRFEKVELGQDFLCIVDYAHTEDALRRVILAARQMTTGSVITVFGCGGQRDRGKRPTMGSLATELSDVVFITSDNPRGEDPVEIIKEIESGARKENYRIVPDRKEAITEAIGMARASDLVLIAGKGHEDYQEVKGVRYPFSDRQVAEDAIRKRFN